MQSTTRVLISAALTLACSTRGGEQDGGLDAAAPRDAATPAGHVEAGPGGAGHVDPGAALAAARASHLPRDTALIPLERGQECHLRVKGVVRQAVTMEAADVHLTKEEVIVRGTTPGLHLLLMWTENGQQLLYYVFVGDGPGGADTGSAECTIVGPDPRLAPRKKDPDLSGVDPFKDGLDPFSTSSKSKHPPAHRGP